MAAEILIVDDDSALRHLLSSLFSLKHWHIKEADTLDSARQLLTTQPFDVIVLDNMLPDGSGTEFVAELSKRLPEAKIVFISAYLDSQATLRGLSESPGVKSVLKKPLSHTAVLEEVERVLRARPALGIEEAVVVPLTPSLDTRARVMARIATIRAAYARKLETTLAKLADELAAAARGQANPAELEEAFEIAHRISGTAASYGFKQVSDAITVVENILFDLVRGARGTQDGDTWERARNHVDRARQVLLVEAPAEAVPDAPPEVKAPACNGTVLVVSDDERLLTKMGQLAHENLIRVVPARGDEEAIAEAREQKIDGALIDVPEDDAEGCYRTAQRLRAIADLSDLPLAFVTWREDIVNRVAATHAGASLILTKPLEAEQFSQAWRYLADLRRASHPTLLILAEDGLEAHGLVVDLRREGIEASALSDPTQLLGVLDERKPDLLLADLALRNIGGLEVCRLLRATPEWRELPVVLMSQNDSDDMLRAAYKAGADDVLPKPFDVAKLLARTGPRLERIAMQRRQAERDTMTGLWQRKPFQRAFDQHLARLVAENHPRRQNDRVVLGLIDLDHFKSINEVHGHLAGDRVLAVMGRLLSRRFRTEDLRCRWGGDEFALLLMREDGPGAAQLIEELLSELRGFRFVDDRGEPFHVAFSAGVACFPSEAATSDNLIRTASHRLATAKAWGRGHAVYTTTD